MTSLRSKSYVHSPSEEPFIGLTMHELLEERVSKHPDREMYVFCNDNERFTFAEYRNKVIDLAAGFLLKLDLRRGDCVAVMGDNHSEWPLITGAARAIGLIVAGLKIGNTIETLKTTMIKVSSKALFILRSPDTLYSDACNIIPELSTCNPADLNSKELPTMKAVIATGQNYQRGTILLDDLYLPGNEDIVIEACRNVKIDDISHICMTSGSTGIPKLVPITHFKALNGAALISNEFDPNKMHRFACTRPMGHVVGTQISQIAPLLLGSTSVFSYPTLKFEKFLETVQDERCTFFMEGTHMISDLAFNPVTESYDLSSLRSGYSVGSPISPSILLHLTKKLGIPVMNVYGTTECNRACSISLEDGLEVLSTVGRPMKNVEIQVVDGNGIPVPVGEVGEVFVRSPVTFDGYYGDEEKTKKAKNSSGWCMTGDIGKVDVNGYLTLIGRMTDIIIRRAVNVYPSIVENVIITHPSVMSVQVVGIPDYRIGEDVCACIRLNGDCSVSKEELLDFCVDKVATMDMPTYVLIFEDFPLGTTGKVDRMKLKQEAASQIIIPQPPTI